MNLDRSSHPLREKRARIKNKSRWKKGTAARYCGHPGQGSDLQPWLAVVQHKETVTEIWKTDHIFLRHSTIQTESIH